MLSPRNFATDIQYQGKNINRLVNAAIEKGFDLSVPYWLTFKQAKALGGYVKGGSKAVKLLFAGSVSRQNPETGETEYKRVARGFSVFHLSQVEFPEDRFPNPGELNTQTEAAD